MRIAKFSLLAGTALLLAACSGGPGSPGTAEWCKNTPEEKQAEDPTAMAACMDAGAKSGS